MTIDEDKIYCPYREKSSKKVKKITFSDHCAMIITLQIETGGQEKSPTTYKAWSFTDDGYSVYREKSEHPLYVDWHPDSTEAYEMWVEKFEQMLSLCFTKKTVKVGSFKPNIQQSSRCVRNILSEEAKKGKIQRKIVKQLLERVIELETRREASSEADSDRLQWLLVTSQYVKCNIFS